MAELFNVNAGSARVGLNLVADPLAFKEGEYSYMLNGALHGVNGSAPFAHIYRGNRRIAEFPPGYFECGRTNLAQRGIVFFLANPATGDSMIGVFDGKTFTPKGSSFDWHFRLDKQIQAVIDEDYNGHVYVIWVDDHNDVRYMDLNNPPIKDGLLDVDATVLFRKYTYPNLKISGIASQGRLLAGSYYVSLQYADENGNGLTGCSTPIGPVYIFRDSLNQPKDFINGSPDREPTNKAIKIELNNIDLSFKYLNIVIVKSYQGIRSAVVASTIPTYQESYLYTGNVDVERDIDLKEVITPSVSYGSAKTIEISNNTLLLGNLKGKREFNLQPYINKIGLQWQLKKEAYINSENSYANPLNGVYEMQYRRNEVYAFGIAIRWNDGSRSRVYPLIARQKNKDSAGNTILRTFDVYNNAIPQGQWDSSQLPVNDDIYESASIPERWQAYNTAFEIGNDLQNPDTDFGAANYGEFGYWESTDRYPNNADVWGEYAGKPILHFKMPDIGVAPITDGKDANRDSSVKPAIYKLGIRFTNIEEIIASFPDEIKAQMDSWELVRADRRNNKSVIASGIIHNMWFTDWIRPGDQDAMERVYAGDISNLDGRDIRLYMNYPHNDLNPDWYIQSAVPPAGLFVGNNFPNMYYRRDLFSFISPDTSFDKNLLFTGELLIHSELYGKSKYRNLFVRPYPALKDSGDDVDDSAYQHISIATYNNWKLTNPGTTRRELKECMYIPFNAQVSAGAAGLPIQNTTRESTVLLYTGKNINNPSIVDNSRVRGSQIDNQINVSNVIRDVSCYYTSIISRISNQYGSVYDPRYCYTNWDSNTIKSKEIVFGGDSYISPFSIKRQLVFFQNAQTFKEWEDGSEAIDLKTTETIYGTTFFYLAKRNNARRDSRTEGQDNTSGGILDGSADLGHLPLIYTGIPVFYCESDYNIDLRLNGNNAEDTYYPNLKDGSVLLQNWVGIENIDKDNSFIDNPSYSEQNDLIGYQNPDPFYNPLNTEVTHFSTRCIYSLESSDENRFNNLFVFLPLNYYDFGRDGGELWDIKNIGNHRVLFRMEHALYEHQFYLRITGKEGELILGSGKAFETKPAVRQKTDGGHSGTHAQWAFNNTPFGAFLIDPVRGIVSLFGNSLNDISANDADIWFLQHLPLKLKQQLPWFPNYDNNANEEGIGFASVYDPQSKMWILTKRDYELVDLSKASHFKLNNEGKLLFGEKVVSLHDTSLFINRSWTISYSPLTQKWVSWHSFVPTSYFEFDNNFYAVQDGAIWCYDNPIPRTYFGKKYPFEIEGVLKQANGSSVLHSCTYTARSFKINGNVQQGESNLDTFNKAVVSGMYGNSGLLKLISRDENNLQTLFKALENGSDFIETELRKRNHNWSFAGIYDRVKDHNSPSFAGAVHDRKLVHSNIDYTRYYKDLPQLNDLWYKMKLIYDLPDDIQMYVYFISLFSEVSVK